MTNPTKHTFLLKSLRILHKYCNFVPFFSDKLILIVNDSQFIER